MALKSLSDHQTNPLDVNAGVDSTSNRIIKVPYVKRTPYGCATRSGFLAVLSGMAGALWAGGVLVLLVGCGVKAVPKGVPFGLDRIPTQKRVSPTEGWKDKGVRLAEEKQYNEAVEAFRNYVVEAPTDFFGFNALAVCYKNMGDHSQAMQNFERALELADSSEEKAKIMANIGNLYFSAEKPQAAL
ncbi:MAG: tetratricopeptide repeat protein, partial [Deltaproteobacteria bacterium]|nr:tetratricopeptide repeat protein [Deltaproteobacteria bacterium]